MYPKPKTSLLCTFVRRSRLDITLKSIQETYDVLKNKIIVVKEKDGDKDNMYCIYDITSKDIQETLPSTILIHRKRGFNSLYTINSLNQLI